MSQPDFSLQNKVALITGGSRGIGETIALCYAQAGANVVLTARSEESLQPALAVIKQAGGKAIGIPAHSGDADAVTGAIETIKQTFGRIDILVNNAATNPHYGPILEADDGVWDKILDVNVKGYARWIRAVAPLMRHQGGGKIINIASILGLKPGPNMGLYSVSKAAVLMLTEALAVELAHDNIQVNALVPGFIKTRFSSALWQNPDAEQTLLGRIPQQRVGDTNELTGLALYLASGASSYTTGAKFVCDGGHIAGSLKL